MKVLFFSVLLLLGSFCVIHSMEEETFIRKKSPDGSIIYIHKTPDQMIFAEKKVTKEKDTKSKDKKSKVTETFAGYKRPRKPTQEKDHTLNEEEKAKLWHELDETYKNSDH